MEPKSRNNISRNIGSVNKWEELKNLRSTLDGQFVGGRGKLLQKSASHQPHPKKKLDDKIEQIPKAKYQLQQTPSFNSVSKEQEIDLISLSSNSDWENENIEQDINSVESWSRSETEDKNLTSADEAVAHLNKNTTRQTNKVNKLSKVDSIVKSGEKEKIEVKPAKKLPSIPIKKIIEREVIKPTEVVIEQQVNSSSELEEELDGQEGEFQSKSDNSPQHDEEKKVLPKTKSESSTESVKSVNFDEEVNGIVEPKEKNDKHKALLQNARHAFQNYLQKTQITDAFKEIVKDILIQHPQDPFAFAAARLRQKSQTQQL